MLISYIQIFLCLLNIFARFDEDTNAVDTQGPAYPRNTGRWWFGCRDDAPRKLQREEEADRRFILD